MQRSAFIILPLIMASVSSIIPFMALQPVQHSSTISNFQHMDRHMEGRAMLIILAFLAVALFSIGLSGPLGSAYPLILGLVFAGSIGAALHCAWRSLHTCGILKTEDAGFFERHANERSMADRRADLLRAHRSKDIPGGSPAFATVVACQQADRKVINLKEYYQLHLDVIVHNGDSWPATIKHLAPKAKLGEFQPGAIFPVKFDPTDRSRVVIDDYREVWLSFY